MFYCTATPMDIQPESNRMFIIYVNLKDDGRHGMDLINRGIICKIADRQQQDMHCGRLSRCEHAAEAN